MTFERFALILTSAALLSLAALRYRGVTTNLTDSEPTGLYIWIPGTPTRGAMVILRPLLKHVAAISGDTVRTTPEGSYVNGKLWPNSAPTASHYKPFAFGTYTLAPGQYWLLGESPDSFDSRYVGMFPDDLINTAVAPLLTASNGYAPATRLW